MLILVVLQSNETQGKYEKRQKRGRALLKTATIFMAAAFIAVGAAFPAAATPISHARMPMNEVSGILENVRWDLRGYRRPFYGYGFAAGAVFGGMFAPPYIVPGPYDYSDPEIDGPFSPIGYCVRRFKSYDRLSGTYLGRNGQRHPCPASQ